MRTISSASSSPSVRPDVCDKCRMLGGKGGGRKRKLAVVLIGVNGYGSFSLGVFHLDITASF